jgi:CAAX protease family protein
MEAGDGVDPAQAAPLRSVFRLAPGPSLSRTKTLLDARTAVIVVLLAGMLLVFGEILRAWIADQLFAPPVPRQPIVFEIHVLIVVALIASLLVLPRLFPAAHDVPPERHISPAGLNFEIAASTCVIAVLLFTLVAGRRNRLADYGIEWRGWLREVRYGGLGFLVSEPLVFVVLIATSPLRTSEMLHPLLKLLKETNSSLIVIEITLAAVVWAPLTEELIFRVILQGLLERKVRLRLAILLPAMAFAAIHGWPDALSLIPLALTLGIVYHLRRSYIAVVTLHAMFNACNLVVALWN